MKKIIIATYGSLKQGFGNHNCLGPNKKLVGKDKIKGVMYLKYNYPHLYHSTPSKFFAKALERTHIIEIYEIDENYFHSINAMEQIAGYNLEETKTKFGKAKIWFNPHIVSPKNLKYIEAYTQEIIYPNK